MDYHGLAMTILLLAEAVGYSLTIDDCEWNEVAVRSRRCANEMTCNSCKVCSPCVCKEGYIREWPGHGCISEDQCHDLHLQWLAAAKYEGKKNTFFNCNGSPRSYPANHRLHRRVYGRPVAFHPNQAYRLQARSLKIKLNSI